MTVKTPECDKLSKIAGQSQKIGEFIDWLEEEGIALARHHEHTEDCQGKGMPPGWNVCGYRDGALRARLHLDREAPRDSSSTSISRRSRKRRERFSPRSGPSTSGR